MFSRVKLWSAVAMIAAMSLVGVPVALAGAPVGSGPDNATGPAAGPVQLAPGQQQWYAFTSSQAPDDATDTRIMVDLAANPQGSASFSVWTAAGARAMLAGNTDATALGNGTVNTLTDSQGNVTDLNNGDLVWVGSSRDATSYFVVVQSNSTTPSSYTLKIAGNYISFPAAAPATQQAPAAGTGTLPPPLVLPATGQQPQVAAAQNGPFNAFPVSGATRQLAVGQQDWYAFQAPGLDANGNPIVTSLLLVANPQGSATFSVWDRNGVQLWSSANPDAKPIGNGTLHPEKDGDNTIDRFGGNLQWSGALADTGTYYVQVQQTGSVPSAYTLQMTQP